MITYEQFDNALNIIVAYKTQVESKNLNNKLNPTFVDIQKNISVTTFLILQTYYEEAFNETIDWNSLKQMDVDKLMLIDYSILRNYRGFGKSSENKLKKVINYVVENTLNLKQYRIQLKNNILVYFQYHISIINIITNFTSYKFVKQIEFIYEYDYTQIDSF